jgi:hypothetical protein
VYENHEPFLAKGFRVKNMIHEQIESRQRRMATRLKKGNSPVDLSKPMMRGPSPQFELSARMVGTAYDGIRLIHQFVQELKLAEAIDERLHLFKFHLPYHESDHVLSWAYNALCEGQCLEDRELRRQDEAYLNLLGAKRIPDPTTAGDFCRRFQPAHLGALQEAFDCIRLKVWAGQPAPFFDCAVIEADGTMVDETGAECKQGIDISYKTKLLRMEFRTFVNYWLRIPCQVLTTGRRLIMRLMAWNRWQPVFFHLAADLTHPLRR